LLSEIEVGAATIDGSPRGRLAAAQRIGLWHVLECSASVSRNTRCDRI
jgi:hypothetical protein